jgi:hypothetical protein
MSGHCHAEGSVSPPVNDPAMYWIGGWVDIKAGLVTEARGKYFVSASDRTPVVQSVVRHYTDKSYPGTLTFSTAVNYRWGRHTACPLCYYFIIVSFRINTVGIQAFNFC